MVIKTIKLKQRIDVNKANKVALRNIKKLFPEMKDHPDDFFFNLKQIYMPFWITHIEVEGHRLIGGTKVVEFFVFVNGLTEKEKGVFRRVIDTIDQDIEIDNIIEPTLGEKEILKAVQEVQDKNIRRQFLFGKPKQEVKGSNLLYCPTWEAMIGNDKENKLNNTFMYISIINPDIIYVCRNGVLSLE